jgi:hypothetical protein
MYLFTNEEVVMSVFFAGDDVVDSLLLIQHDPIRPRKSAMSHVRVTKNPISASASNAAGIWTAGSVVSGL